MTVDITRSDLPVVTGLEPLPPRVCPGCAGPVRLVKFGSGRVLAVDDQPHPSGTVAAWPDVNGRWHGRWLVGRDKPGEGETRHQQHDATCPGLLIVAPPRQAVWPLPVHRAMPRPPLRELLRAFLTTTRRR